jgi:hypothetical protein
MRVKFSLKAVQHKMSSRYNQDTQSRQHTNGVSITESRCGQTSMHANISSLFDGYELTRAF